MRLEGLTLGPLPWSGRGSKDDYCTTPSITFGALVTVGIAPRYSLSVELLGSCVPPEGSVIVLSVIDAHGEDALAPRLFSRTSASSALTISGTAGVPGRVIVAPSGIENIGT